MNQVPQEKGVIVPSEMIIIAQKSLNKSVAKDMFVEDPEESVVKAALKDGEEDE